MRSPQDPNPTIRAAVASRWLRRSLAAGVLAAASLAVAACGSSGSPRVVDTKMVERAIQQSSFAQRRIRAQVSCPSGVRQQRGLVFSCTAVYSGGSARFVVTELDGSGHVRYVAR